VAELTGLHTLAGWPEEIRVIVRRERPHLGAQLPLFEERDDQTAAARKGSSVPYTTSAG
jgi:hypothetical protein